MTIRKTRDRGFKTVFSILEEFLPAIVDGQDVRIGTGLLELDHLTTGLAAGHLVVIGSRPEIGKTSFALSVAEHAAMRQGRSVCIFSIESTDRIVASRILALESLVPVRSVLSGRLTARQYQAILEANHRLAKLPIFIDAVRQLDIERLVDEANRAREAGHLDLLIVDDVQSLRDFSRRYESREEEFDATVRSLKHLARDLEIPLIAVSQVSTRRRTQIPRVEDLEGAAPLTDHADLILLIHRPEPFPGQFDESSGLADIIVAKNRLGLGGTFKAVFLENVPAFRNFSPSP